MNQRVKRAIAAAMSLTMAATATPVSPLYNAIQNAVSSVMMQASAADNKYIINYDNDTFSIASFDDLNMFAEAVNGGKDFSGKTVKLADNFDMGTNALTTPIGTYEHSFKGTFDGNNKTIKLNIESAKGYAGLFGYVDGATIMNITVTGYAYCADVAGGICGQAVSSNVYNCANIAEVTGGSTAGGILGYATYDLNVYNCTNNAAVKATNGAYGYAGGILGYADEYAYLSVYNCANIATVTSEYGAGGICGYSFFSPLVHNCINIAAVSGQTDIGGICGGSSEDPYIDNCYVLDVNNKFNEKDVTEINAEQLKGTQKVDEKTLTVTELLNDYVDTFNSTDITLLEWEQGQDYPILKIPVSQDAYTKIDGTNLKWKLEDDGKLTISLIKTDETDTTKNAMPDWEPGNKPTPWENINTSITSVEICDGVTHIGKCAFYGYNSVTELTIGNDVTSIGNNAFNNTRIESVIIPDSVKSIGNMTFAFNAALKSVVLGNNVELIDQGAFISTGLTSIIIPAKVTKICYGAFSNDADLKEIVFKGNPPEIIYDVAIPAAFSGVGTQDNPVKLLYPKGNASWETFLNGKDEVFEWEGGTFKAEAYTPWNKIDGTNLQWTIDEGKLTIDRIDETITDENLNAMPGWYGNIHSPWYNNTSITSVQIKDGVTNIGSDAFKGCSGLTSIAIPNSVTSFGGNAFNDCSKLSSITIPSGVTEIDNSAFENFSGLTSITIPSGVTEIGDNAFMNCSALTSITIPASVTSISSGVFNGCSKLTEITIPSGVTIISSDVFNGCSALTSITIPSGVTEIGSDAFCNCSALKEISIPSGVTSIGEWAFKGCELLESITLPSDVTSISSRTFEDCSALKEIIIPSGVTKFYDNAFSGCTALTSIKFEGDVPEIKNDWEEEADAFNNVGETTPAILYYPKDNATWEDLLKDKSEIFEWKGGTFKAEAYLNWNDIADTNLHWAISANGTLYIDKQETPSGSNFTIPDFDGNAPWKDYVNQIRFVNISKDVENVNDTSFKDLIGHAFLILEDGYNGTKPSPIDDSTYDSFGGGEFIYSKSQLTGASLSLDGQIGVNISFYVNRNEGSTITINGKTVDLSECECNGDIYTYTLWVAPKDAYNDITFKTVKGSDTIVEQTYSVKSQYVDVVLADTEHKKYNERVFDMVTALDSYMNSSRVYFGIETDSDKITEINSAIDKITVVIPSKIGTPEFNETMYYGSSLILDSGVKVRHYIKIADGTDISKFKLAVNGNDITDAELTKSGIKSGSDDVYFFETDEFNPIDFDKKVSVTYDGTNVIDKYSVLSYIKLALNNETTKDTKLGTMCKALYNYYVEAGKY